MKHNKRVDYLKLDISKLVKADWNYKGEDLALTSKLVENIKRNGQIENLIVRELEKNKYEVVNGNHRYDALVAIGATEAFVYNLGKIDEATAKRIAVETNESKFKASPLKLAEVLEELSLAFPLEDLLSTLPFSNEQLQAKIALLKFDPSDYAKRAAEDSGEIGNDAPIDELRFILKDKLLEAWLEVKVLADESWDDYKLFLEVISVYLEGLSHA